MTIRGWAHLILVDIGRACSGETGPDGRLQRVHEEQCQTLCDHLVAFGAAKLAEELAKEPAPGPSVAFKVAGVHSGHVRRECSCGAVISQCRCMGPKTVEIVTKGCAACRARN